MTEMNDPVEIRRRIEAMLARIDRRDDYGQLLARGDVLRNREDVASPDEWRAELRRQARGDRLKIRTGVNAEIVFAILLDAGNEARHAEARRYWQVLHQLVPIAVTLAHEPGVLARDGDEAVLRCERCPALGYLDVAAEVCGGALLEDECPHDAPPRRTGLGFMHGSQPSGS